MDQLALGRRHASYPTNYAIPSWIAPFEWFALRNAALRRIVTERFPLGRFRSYLIANFIHLLFETFEGDEFERLAGIGRSDVRGYLFEIGEYDGVSGLQQLLRDWGEAFPGMESEIERWVEPTRGTFVLLYRHAGVAVTSGIAVGMDPGLVATMEAGWLTEIRFYRDGMKALEAVGLSE